MKIKSPLQIIALLFSLVPGIVAQSVGNYTVTQSVIAGSV